MLSIFVIQVLDSPQPRLLPRLSSAASGLQESPLAAVTSTQDHTLERERITLVIDFKLTWTRAEKCTTIMSKHFTWIFTLRICLKLTSVKERKSSNRNVRQTQRLSHWSIVKIERKYMKVD